MIAELVEIGKELDRGGHLTPVGFYDYGQPIRWVIHIWDGNQPRVHIEEAELKQPRPSDGRTSGISAFPVADEAGYVFGIGARGSEKQTAYLQLFEKLLSSKHVATSELRDPLQIVRNALQNRLIENAERFSEIERSGETPEKAWVSFVVETGARAGRHLYDETEIRDFWADELGERLSTSKKRKQPATGECAICGQSNYLVLRIPKVKLQSVTPLHSFNRSAFPSLVEGADCHEWTHLGLCYRCGDTAARAFNYLRDNPYHHRELIRDVDKLDSLNNHFAFYWLKEPPVPVEVGEIVIDWDELLRSLGTTLADGTENKNIPTADVAHMHNLVSLPWKPSRASLNLDEFSFYLALVSPNVGRIAVREWIVVSLNQFRKNLRRYLDGLNVQGPWGEELSPVSISQVLLALNVNDTGIVRALMRTAFLGFTPSAELIKRAVPRWRAIEAKRPKDNRERFQHERFRHALASIVKLVLTHHNEMEVQTMQTLDDDRNTQPYLCGQLLAILEETQLRAHNWRLNSTLVDRAYGTASTAPATIFGRLIRAAETAHLPKIRKSGHGNDKLKQALEQVVAKLDARGGFPRTLTMQNQAEFAIGFYHQRAKYRSERGNGEPKHGEDNVPSNQE